MHAPGAGERRNFLSTARVALARALLRGSDGYHDAGKRNCMPNIRIEIAIPVEGATERPIAAHGYLFDVRGRLLARAPLADGTVSFDVDPAALRRAKFVLAPAEAGLPDSPGLDALRRVGAYEPPLTLSPDKPRYELGSLPPEVWKRWLFCSCLVQGSVVRPVTVGDHTLDLPVCHARVHICEVDPWPLLIAKIPDRYLLRVREELLRPRPLPDPPPIRVEPVRLRLRPTDRLADATVPRLTLDPAGDALRLRLASLDLAPEVLEELAVSDPELVAAAMAEAHAPPAELPAELRRSLQSEAPPVLRAALEKHLDVLVPWLCRWPWFWPLLRKDEVAVVETDLHGRFAARVIYPCAGDKPDIYVWVEYAIGGAWTPVHKQPVACATQWNYPCGKDITIRVTDPRVPWCGDVPDMPGTEIGVITIGNAVNVRQIDAGGLAPGAKPFGGSLEPTVWFGAGLLAAGITHYRWSYRRLAADATPAEAWHACDEFVGRHYGVSTPAGLLFKVYKVGPDDAVAGDTLFHIPPVAPPAGNWAPQLNARSNTASAYFVTGVPGLRRVPDGLYELKLELFRVVGGAVTQARGLDFRVPPVTLAAPFLPDAEIAFEAAPESYLVRGATGAVEGFVLKLQVDNSPCIAAIYPTTVPGSTQECGFITFPAGPASARLGFVAAHPRGHGDLDFSVIRGSCTVGAVAAAGKTGASPIAGFALDGVGVYVGNFPVSTLLGPLAAPPSACAGSCRRAAFAEHLHVYARATDGWSWRLSYLDAHAVVAFALNPE